MSRIDRGTDAKVDRARARASSDSFRTGYISRLRAGASGRNIAFLASIFALCGTAVAIAAPTGSTVGDSPGAPNSPGLAQVGAVAKNGFPAWYKDKHGTRLEPCLDATDPMCIMGALADPSAPVDVDDVTGNFPDEFFYQAASAGLDNVGAPDPKGGKLGKASLTAALEGAFANAQAPGEQMVFARLRLRVTSGLEGNTNYLFVHPYGERTIKTDATPDLFVTEDIGTVAGKFDDALKGRIAPFLQWDDSAPAAPEGYIGDPNVDHPITGGVNNVFAVIGPGVGANKLNDGTQDCGDAVLAKANNAPGATIKGTTPNTDAAGNPVPGVHIGERDCISTSLFSLMGKLAQNAGVDVKNATFSRDGDGNTAVDVQAESDGNQTIVVRDPSANRNTASRMFPTTKLTEDQGGRYYAHVKVKGTSFPDGSQVELVNATDGNPQDTKPVSPVDEILNATATWDNTLDTAGHGVLTVAAKSSDQFGGDNVILSVDDPEGVGQPTPLGATGQLDIKTLPSAPRTVTITSSKGGTLTIPVHADMTKPETLASLTAVASGPRKAVASGATVKLFGTGSTGPIASYAWTGPFVVNADGSVSDTKAPAAAGGAITAGATTDTATVTAPTAADRYGYKLEVTGDDGKTATPATTILTVTGGGVVAGIGDPLTPGTVRYTETQGRMVIDGTATVRTSNKILIWFAKTIPADPAHTKPDATAIVDPVDGSWAYDTGRGGMPTPPNADCVSYISTHGDPAKVGSDAWNCLPIDGRKLTVPLPPAGDPPAADAGAGGAAGAAAGPAAAIAGPVAASVPGLGARIAVAAARVAGPATVNAAAFATTGVPVTVTVPRGANIVRLRVLSTANKALFSTFKKVKGGTKVTVKIKSAKLRKQLRAGTRVVIEARAGAAKNRLGKATRKVMRVRA